MLFAISPQSLSWWCVEGKGSIGFVNKINHPNIDEITSFASEPLDPLNGEAVALMMRDRIA
ncbi:hypothetical protein RJ641_036494 [Dillenia turbinata]|uniref:Uncharacterized protein n=1 Tax=Dillenia turbinata TaxID=194707 RepID=A0AAN8ZGI0_9MAGN